MDNDIDEIMESLEKKSEHAEAPMSIHIDAYLEGFHVGFTKRYDKSHLAGEVMNISAFVKMLKEQGFMPSWNTDTNKKVSAPPSESSAPTEGLKCATCGESATFKSGEKNGRKWTAVFCSSENKSHTKWGR